MTEITNAINALRFPAHSSWKIGISTNTANTAASFVGNFLFSSQEKTDL